MIVVVKHGASEKQIENLTNWFKAKGVEPDVSKGTDMTIIGLVGDVSKIDTELVEALDIVDSVKRVSEPFKQANRKFHPDDTVVTLKNGTKIGGGNFVYMAGPCSVESEGQGGGRSDSAGRRIQAPDIPLFLPGHGRGRYPTFDGGKKGDWSAHRDRADGH